MKLRPEFSHQSGGFKLRQHSGFFKNLAVIRKQRFADVKPRKMLLLQHQNLATGLGQVTGRGAPTRPTANDYRIVLNIRHNEMKPYLLIANKQSWQSPTITASPQFSLLGRNNGAPRKNIAQQTQSPPDSHRCCSAISQL